MPSEATTETAPRNGARNGLQPDPRALEVAREIHREYGPLATILFGSRARGDYRENCSDTDISDIDLLLVEESPPDEVDQYKIEHSEQSRSLAVYGKKVRIHLIWTTPAKILEHDAYINSLCTQAMMDGVTISDTPERFRSRYDSKDPPDPQYEWSTYQAHLAGSLNNMKLIHLVIAQKAEDWETADSIRILPPWNLLTGQRLGWQEARNFAVRSMHGALAAAIAATGEVPKGHDLAPQHMERLRALLPGEDLDTAITMEDYADGGGEESTDEAKRDFALTAMGDIEKIRAVAKRTRRQTGRGAQGTRRDRSGEGQ